MSPIPYESLGCTDEKTKVYVDGGWTDSLDNCRCPVDRNLVEASSSFCIDADGNWIDGGYLNQNDVCVHNDGQFCVPV
jgi:hypothetical protein